MIFKFLANFFAATLTLYVSGTYKAAAQSFVPPVRVLEIEYQSTVFKCLPYGTDFFITVAQKGEREAALFMWHRNNFPPNIPPGFACNLFSERLTNVVAQNNGSLNNLLLTVGRVKGNTVLCFVNNSQKGCNVSNVLFTLTPEDASQYNSQPYQFLEKLTNFQFKQLDPTILQLAGHALNDINPQPYFSLQAWEREYLKADKDDYKFTREPFSQPRRVWDLRLR
ncbi:COP23 domain-containing protein [Ancylothrix sp. C2]|nr:COP23 domain-containing protein [Ancylothrix sp. D3o]